MYEVIDHELDKAYEEFISLFEYNSEIRAGHREIREQPNSRFLVSNGVGLILVKNTTGIAYQFPYMVESFYAKLHLIPVDVLEVSNCFVTVPPFIDGDEDRCELHYNEYISDGGHTK